MKNNIEIGSRVFCNALGALSEYEIIDFRLLEKENGNYQGEVVTRPVKQKGKLGEILRFPLDMFIKGMEDAQNMKISDIRR